MPAHRRQTTGQSIYVDHVLTLAFPFAKKGEQRSAGHHQDTGGNLVANAHGNRILNRAGPTICATTPSTVSTASMRVTLATFELASGSDDPRPCGRYRDPHL